MKRGKNNLVRHCSENDEHNITVPGPYNMISLRHFHKEYNTDWNNLRNFQISLSNYVVWGSEHRGQPGSRST